MKMTYKDYELVQNPTKIEIISNTNVSSLPVIEGSSVVENVSVNPIVVRCVGELYDDEGKECCDRLQYLLRQQSAGWLFAPELTPIWAYFTSFSYSKGASKGSISYIAEFTECCSKAGGNAKLNYTRCREGENLFDVANRCDIRVEELMAINSFASPFDINIGDRVMLR